MDEKKRPEKEIVEFIRYYFREKKEGRGNAEDGVLDLLMSESKQTVKLKQEELRLLTELIEADYKYLRILQKAEVKLRQHELKELGGNPGLLKKFEEGTDNPDEIVAYRAKMNRVNEEIKRLKREARQREEEETHRMQEKVEVKQEEESEEKIKLETFKELSLLWEEVRVFQEAEVKELMQELEELGGNPKPLERFVMGTSSIEEIREYHDMKVMIDIEIMRLKRIREFQKNSVERCISKLNELRGSSELLKDLEKLQKGTSNSEEFTEYLITVNKAHEEIDKLKQETIGSEELTPFELLGELSLLWEEVRIFQEAEVKKRTEDLKKLKGNSDLLKKLEKFEGGTNSSEEIAKYHEVMREVNEEIGRLKSREQVRLV